MESIKLSIQEMTQHFSTKMAEFQQNLNTSIPATSPTSNIAAQFSAFRTFVLSALEGLQMQVQILSKQYDLLEMRSRKKILLVHGVAESQKEDTASTVIKQLADLLEISDLSQDDVNRCQRLGAPTSEKPRPIILKFRDLAVKSQVWHSKTKLKNTGITLSEFLTKPRHEAFLAARKQFGVTKCWMKDGFIIIIGSDGRPYSISSRIELNNIPGGIDAQGQTVSTGNITTTETKTKKITQVPRTKRIVKK